MNNYNCTPLICSSSFRDDTLSCTQTQCDEYCDYFSHNTNMAGLIFFACLGGLSLIASCCFAIESYRVSLGRPSSLPNNPESNILQTPHLIRVLPSQIFQAASLISILAFSIFGIFLYNLLQESCCRAFCRRIPKLNYS